MPDVSKTEIGRRMYLVHKEKNVDKVIEKIRENPGAEWKKLSEDEVHLLERLLAEVWITCKQREWEKIPFSRITRDDIKKILSTGKNLELDKVPPQSVAGSVGKILFSLK